MSDPILTAERLRELVIYDPHTGVFTCRVKRGKLLPGVRAGCQRPDGYRTLMIDGKSYLEGRLAWLFMKGAWPGFEIDHHDLDPSNSAWDNLREATRVQNECNKKARSDNRTGMKGVRRAHQRTPGWTAGVYVSGKYKHLGTFPTPELAASAYATAADTAYGRFARHG